MVKDSDILDKIGRRSGMTVPENYFADFAARMEAKLPEHKATPSGKVLHKSVWQRCRPYIYMAAMFLGIWLMMWIFNDISDRNTNSDMSSNPVMAGVLGSDRFYDYYPMNDIDEYELIEDMYDDGVTLADFKL